MTSFFVAAGGPSSKKQSSLPNHNYTLDERKLMADILYEDLNNQRATVRFNREERRIMAEVAREKDLESKANQAELYTEKLQQMQTKREEMEAIKIAKAQSKLKRVDITEKPDLVSNIVKKYDMKRSEVLERIHKKEQELRMKIERTMNREKPELLSDITKKYDEKRTEVLERIEKKREELRLKHEEKMNRVPQDKSVLLPDIAKNYDKRRSEVINRINCMEEEKKKKLENKMKRVENANKRHKEKIKTVREKTMMNGFDQSLEEFNDIDGDQGYRGRSGEEDDEMVSDVKKQMTDTDNDRHQPDGQQSNNTVGLMSSYNTFITKTVLPPIIGCN